MHKNVEIIPLWEEGGGTEGEPLNGIDLGQTITDPIHGMKTITKYFSNCIPQVSY
jgi:hypothetical protein